MKFLILMLSLLLQRQTSRSGYRRKRIWFSRVLQPLALAKQSIPLQVGGYFLSVIFPSVLLAVFFASLHGLLLGLIAVLLQIALFLYVLGRDDFNARLRSYREAWQRGDYQAAFESARGFLSLQAQTQVVEPQQLHTEVSAAINYAWFMRFFVPVFWFMLLGIPGAFLWLLSFWFKLELKQQWSDQLVDALIWIPSRLLALTFCLAGDFTGAFREVVKSVRNPEIPAAEVLAASAQGALPQMETFSDSEALKALENDHDLLIRSAVIWLVLIAAATILGHL